MLLTCCITQGGVYSKVFVNDAKIDKLVNMLSESFHGKVYLFLSSIRLTMGRYFETMQILYYSSNFHLLVLASIDDSCLSKFLLW